MPKSQRAPYPPPPIDAPVVLLDLLAAHGIDAAAFAADVRRDNGRRGRFHSVTARDTTVPVERIRALPPVGVSCLGGPARAEIGLDGVHVTCHGDGTAHVRIDRARIPDTIEAAWQDTAFSRVVGHPLLARPEYVVIDGGNARHLNDVVVRIRMPSAPLPPS